MTTTTLSILFIFIVVVGIIGYLVKSLVKVAVIGLIIYLLFNVAFVWGADEVMTKLGLDRFLKPEVSQQVKSEYETFVQKREEYGVVDTTEIKNVVEATLQESLKQAGDQWSAVDKQALLDELKQKLAEYDSEAVQQALDELQGDLAQADVTPQEVTDTTTTP